MAILSNDPLSPSRGEGWGEGLLKTNMQLIRSIFFYIGFYIGTVFFSTAAMLNVVLPKGHRHWSSVAWAWFSLWWLKVTCGLNYHVEGREHLRKDNNAIVLCKHQSSWETMALQCLFPRHAWVLKRELLFIPVFGWALAMQRPIAINRKRASREQVIEQGLNRLKDGRTVIIFPEGTRVQPGMTRRFAIGGALLAEKSGYPVIPIALNAGEYWPRRGFIKKPGTIKLVIGPSIDSHGKTATEINQEVHDWIQNAMHTISGS